MLKRMLMMLGSILFCSPVVPVAEFLMRRCCYFFMRMLMASFQLSSPLDSFLLDLC